jgi:lactoylglutathione lyase
MRYFLHRLLCLALLAGSAGFLRAADNDTPRFDHLAFYVVDQKRSADFYRDLVGLKEIPEPFHDGKHAWFSLGTGMALHIISGATAPLPKEKRTHLCLAVASMEAFTARLTKAGIVYEDLAGKKHAVTLRPDGVHQIYFQDPDDNWIEINDAKP